MARALVIMFILAGCYFTAFGAVSGYKQPVAAPKTNITYTSVEVLSHNEIASHNSADIDGGSVLLILCGVTVLVLILKKKG